MPKYYKVVLSKTEYGDPTGDTAKYYEWSKNLNGENELKEVSSPTDGKQTITVKFDSVTNPRFKNTDTSGVDISGNFVGQSIEDVYDHNGGGAISNGGMFNYAKIGSIIGDFIGNYSSGSFANGGAIYNGGTIGDITGDFIGNHTSGSGGAIYNDLATIGNITGDFIGNYATQGGAIYNWKTIGNLTGNFIGNYAFSSSYAWGGAIDNSYGGKIGNITGDFIGNYASTSSTTSFSTYANGGAIYNDIDATIGAKDADGKVIGGIINSNFINNYAKAESTISSVSAKGGAIYTSNNLNIIADNGTSLFSGNKTITTINKGTDQETTVEDQNAIYVDATDKTLTLNSKNNGIIQFDDKIDGQKGYKVALTGDSTGTIILNNNVHNANVTSENITLSLGKNDVFKNSDFTINSGALSLINNTAEQQIMQSANINGNINLALDVNLANQTMDTLSDNTTLSNNAKIGVKYINLLNDATENITEIQFAPEDYAQAVSYTGANPIAYTPIYKYDVSYNPDNGMFVFTGGPGGSAPNNPDNFNPGVLAPPVATQAGAYTTQLQTFNYAFQHSDSFMNIPSLERMAIKNQNKYALSPTGDATDVGVFSPLFTKNESAGIWFKPYASFESIPLNNGPKVSNINYGSLVGFDSSLKSVAHGFDRVITGYIGYNGASQRYQGVDAYQNGAIIGSTFTFYKGNLFNATTASVGASAGSANNMYGSENYTMLLAGIANKTGYNFEFLKGKLILQPSMLISYTFVNTFDYHNAAGLSIKSDPLNAIQLAPGIKLIGNTKTGWQPYIGISMVWNLLDKTKVTANDVRLPEMSIKPYVQYGVGLQKRFGERLTGFTQAMMHNGGRNGVSLTAGVRWAI